MSNQTVKLYENEVVYRPPLEANSVLLEVTRGCSWGKCTFCRDVENGKVVVNSLVDIEAKLHLLGSMEENRERPGLFFLGSNSFALSYKTLKNIFILVHQYLPNITRINMFSRADDIWSKSDAEMQELKSLGLGDLYIGLESGSDKVLQRCCKGLTSKDMLDCFGRLESLGIDYSLSSIIGLGGKADSREHALETARVYSASRPRTIRIMTLTPWPGTPLYSEIERGDFVELSPWEMLIEERMFLNAMDLTVENCIFVGTHVSNNVPLAGLLPKHKSMLLEILDEVIAATDPTAVTRTSFEQW